MEGLKPLDLSGLEDLPLTRAKSFDPEKSPFENASIEHWPSIAQALVEGHPLTWQLAKFIEKTWDVFHTQSVLGSAIKNHCLLDLNISHSAKFKLFEVAMGLDLEEWTQGAFKNGHSKLQKDLHCSSNPWLSIEMKLCGAGIEHIYGNRSHAAENASKRKGAKLKSGFFLAINVHKHQIQEIRFGWIDPTDWQAQKSASGQKAELSKIAYHNKLVLLEGDYLWKAPVLNIKGIGPQAVARFNSLGVHNLEQLMSHPEGYKYHAQIAKQYPNLLCYPPELE